MGKVEGKEFTGDARLLFPNKYVGYADLKGKEVTLTISDLRMDMLRVQGGDDEEKPILYFRETDKALVLNKTNTRTLMKLLGTETKGWRGERITLYGTTCQAFGSQVDCVRIRDRKPRPKRGRPEPEPAAGELTEAEEAAMEAVTAGTEISSGWR